MDIAETLCNINYVVSLAPPSWLIFQWATITELSVAQWLPWEISFFHKKLRI